jgi:hypothetical protein
VDHLHNLVSRLFVTCHTARVTDPTYWTSQGRTPYTSALIYPSTNPSTESSCGAFYVETFPSSTSLRATMPTHIAAVNTAPSLLQLTDDHLQDLSIWLTTWIGWGMHRKLDWALQHLSSVRLRFEPTATPGTVATRLLRTAPSETGRLWKTPVPLDHRQHVYTLFLKFLSRESCITATRRYVPRSRAPARAPRRSMAGERTPATRGGRVRHGEPGGCMHRVRAFAICVERCARCPASARRARLRPG